MRVVRINELIKREISSILHTRYRDASVRITISDVVVSPELRDAVVYYAVVGGDSDVASAGRFFAKEGAQIRMLLGKSIVIKFLPKLAFRLDRSLERGAKMNAIIDSISTDGAEQSSQDEA